MTTTKLCYRQFDGQDPQGKWHYFEIGIPIEAIGEMPHSGSVDNWAEEWIDEIDFSHVTDEALAAAMSEYTDWDVSDRRTNMMRAIWIAAGDFHDGFDLEEYTPEHYKQ